MLRFVALAAIRLYQRHVSPYKGFSCAYRIHGGKASCSTVGYRVFRRHGIFTGLALTRERTARCGDLQRQVMAGRAKSLKRQQGFCDGCDVPTCDAPGCGDGWDVCDLSDACDCGGCDWWGRRKKPDEDERRGGSV